MKRKPYIEAIAKRYEEAVKVVDAKSQDYARDEDPFYNFRLCETLEICSLETGILVRMCDKVARLSRLINHAGAVADESIHDTLTDLSNYATIMSVYLEDKNGNGNK